jgi:hypothetical protein
VYNYRCIAYSNVYWECLIKMRDIQSSEYSTGYSWVHYSCQSWDFCRMASKFHRLNRSTTKSGSAECFNNSGQGILVQEIVWIGFLNFWINIQIPQCRATATIPLSWKITYLFSIWRTSEPYSCLYVISVQSQSNPENIQN